MDAEQLVVNKSREGEVVEDVGAVLPHVHRPVLAQTLIVEPIHLSDLSWLVISSENGDSILVPNLQDYQEGYSLDWVIASIYVISHE